MPNTSPIGFAYADMALDGTSIVNSPGISMNAGSTTMTTGFNHIPAAAGAPTGAPSNPTGNVPLYYDSTNHKIYVYSGGTWRSTAALT